MHYKETRLLDLRLDNNLKQKDLGKVLEVSEDRYSKYERGIDDMTLQRCNALANFYNVSIDYLLGLSNINIKPTNNNINYKILSKRLFQLRKEHNLTQAKLCKKIGFPQTTYSCYETGKSIPTTFKVYHIVCYYNVSFDYILGRTNKRKIDNHQKN